MDRIWFDFLSPRDSWNGMRDSQNVIDIVERNGWGPEESRSLKRLRQLQQDLGQFL